MDFCPTGTDPATDLRGTGFLGLMHILHFVMDPETLPLARDIYKLSQHPTQVSAYTGVSLHRRQPTHVPGKLNLSVSPDLELSIQRDVHQHESHCPAGSQRGGLVQVSLHTILLHLLSCGTVFSLTNAPVFRHSHQGV